MEWELNSQNDPKNNEGMMCQTHPHRLIDAPFNGIVDAMLGVLAKL